jgi:hypothetical protein
MIYPPLRFEQQRSEVLQRYRILNGSEVHVASQVAQTAALALGVPIVLTSLLPELVSIWVRSELGRPWHARGVLFAGNPVRIRFCRD